MEQKVYIKTEKYSIERIEATDNEPEKVIFSGTALPFGKESRNRCTYDKKRALEVMDTMNNVAFLLNHEMSLVLGHVIEVKEGKNGINYRADVDPEEKEFIRKAERGDYKNVSIGTIIDKVEEFEDENKVPNLFIKEFIELSAVSVPGFLDATLNKEGFISIESFLETETNKYHSGNTIMSEDKDKDKTPSGETEAEKLDAFIEGTKEALNTLSESLKSVVERVENIETSLKQTGEKTDKLTTEFKKVETSLVNGKGAGEQKKEYSKEGLAKAMGGLK